MRGNSLKGKNINLHGHKIEPSRGVSVLTNLSIETPQEVERLLYTRKCSARALVTCSVKDIFNERKNMEKIEALKEKRNRLLQNGKNTEASGVIRKLDRKIRNLEKTK